MSGKGSIVSNPLAKSGSPGSQGSRLSSGEVKAAKDDSAANLETWKIAAAASGLGRPDGHLIERQWPALTMA